MFSLLSCPSYPYSFRCFFDFASYLLFFYSCTLFVIMHWLNRFFKFDIYCVFISLFIFFSLWCRLLQIYIHVYCLIKSHCTTLIWKIWDLRNKKRRKYNTWWIRGQSRTEWTICNKHRQYMICYQCLDTVFLTWPIFFEFIMIYLKLPSIFIYIWQVFSQCSKLIKYLWSYISITKWDYKLG